ncbi:MAG TPA: competence/damage-inducible protein A [Thermoanaerobaculia bacterium]|nr:competence/damage-inducible protein A [Thermoanaerobaculia bacterium]
MKAAIIAVGSELLGTGRLDTNSLTLTGVFERYGVALVRKSVLGDHEGDLAEEIRHLLPKVGLIVITGGLGPTADDITREAVAEALGRGLTLREELVEAIASRFARMGLTMPESNRKQAEVIDGARVLSNDRGTAPGLALEEGETAIFLFPGVPGELAGMIERELEPWLARRRGGVARETTVLRVALMPESTVEERIRPAYGEFGREAITILAKPGDIELRATAEGPEPERRALLARMSERLTELVGSAVYTREEDDNLETVAGRLLAERGLTFATAESCTGGLVAERVTRVAGSSDYFVGGVVSYSNQLKTQLLGVPAELIDAHGAVSEEVARAMAEGGRARLGADLCLAVTGVAGPGGGSAGKPVGTVHLALAGPAEGEVLHRKISYPGDRERVRWLSSQVGLEMLRRHLLDLPPR